MTGAMVVYSILAALILIGGLVSLSMKPNVRSWRNVTMLGCYIVGAVSFFIVDFVLAISVWIGLGLLAGVAYFAYDLWITRRRPDPKIPAELDYSHLVYGLFAWPLMLIEVFEYTWAEFFPLQPERASPSDKQS